MGIQGVSLVLLPVLGALILDFIYRLYRRRQRFKDLVRIDSPSSRSHHENKGETRD